tara:strand:- start:114 stop:437 length:324 start_codon:yes stop_codon:yes gene_type:complete
MKTFNEKEKKLQEALEKLSNFSISNLEQTTKIDELINQKNQLEIEKNDLIKKYLELETNFNDLKSKISILNIEKKNNNLQEEQFEKKIDELNQETDILLEELDKWET